MTISGQEVIVREELRYIGRSITRIDGVEKVTGRAIYGVDTSFPNMLYGKIKRSEVPHAEIVSIDVSKALKVPGVRAVITALDIPDSLFGAGLSDTPVLARDRVRYVGEPVAAVAADTVEAAEEAVALIEVKYRELRAVFDPEEAMREDPPAILHPKLTEYKVTPTWPPVIDPRMPNVCNHVRVKRGDVEEGFSKADLIVENRFTTNLVQHVHMEPNVAVARAEGDGGVTIWTSTQSVYRTRHMLSEALQIPPSKVRVISTEVGGGFGNKLNSITCEAIAALLSMKTGRPVKVQLSREEVFATTTTRHPFIIYVKDGVMRDGRIIARKITAILDGGAYSAGSGVAVGRNAIFAAVTTYDIPNMQIDTYRVYTNKVPSGAFRGFGTMQMAWAIESQMDIIAEKLGMDPVDLRLINILEEGRPSVIGELVYGLNHKECLLQLARLISSRKSESRHPWFVGRGIALVEKYSGEPGACAAVRYRPDGFVEAWVSVDEIGQGTRTGIAQIVAEELKMPIEKVKVLQADSDLTPYDSGALSSRQTYNVGNAVILACRDLKDKILEEASKKLGVDKAWLEVVDGKIVTRDGRSMEISDLFIRGKSRYGVFLEKGGDFWGFGTWFVETGELDQETGQATRPRLNTAYTSGAIGVEVAVNVETGEVRVLRSVVVADVGKAINPKLVEGQIEGAVAMGISTALYEELVLEKGRVINADFKDYKVMNIYNAPPIEIKLLETPSLDGPFGAKPVGEFAIVGISPAIANAIRDAIGVRIYDLPITAERLLRAIKGNS